MADELDLDLVGNFLVNRSNELGPRTICFAGQSWFRFMDRIYTNRPVYKLSSDDVRELCDLRLELGNSIIVADTHQRVEEALIHIAAKYCSHKSPRIILDFGAGDGRSMRPLRAHFGPGVIGCDISAYALSQSTERSLVRISPRGPLPFSDHVFDIIYALFVMHFDVSTELLCELARCCALNGILVANVYGPSIIEHRLSMAEAGWKLAAIESIRGVENHKAEVWRLKS